jgi:mono/diheme cytochrome c family protein/glucose/arabinose dehydrogenase
MKKIFFILLLLIINSFVSANTDHLVFEPNADKANNKHIVIVTGDEEYRSEEWGPMLGKILSLHHGFKVTVLFAIDNETGVINPNNIHNIPQLSVLDAADLMILGTRMRKLPPEQMRPILDYLNAAKPIIALRTATHAFHNDDHYGGYDWQDFGRKVLGENWLNHHGEHNVEGGRGVIVPENADHHVLNGVTDIFTLSDIYGIANLDQNAATILLRGAVTKSLEPNSAILDGQKNNPMMPLAWLKPYPTPSGKKSGTAFVTTAGAAVDFQKEDLRRLIINASYHLLGLPVPKHAVVDPVDLFEPSHFSFQPKDYFLRRGLRVEDFSLGHSAKSIISEDDIKKLEDLRAQEKSLQSKLPLKRGDKIVLIGNGLAERMLNYGYFETELLLRYPQMDLTIRNLAKPGDTPAFRPHPSRSSQWAFPGAEKTRPEFSVHHGEGHYPSPDEWLTTLQADTIIAFFGFNESFGGADGEAAYRKELEAFIDHTLKQKYNGKKRPSLALVSPIAFQNLSTHFSFPSGEQENINLLRYSQIMQEVAASKGIHFIDLYSPTRAWFITGSEQLTVNGAHLNEKGYQRLAPVLADALFGKQKIRSDKARKAITQLVRDKNFYWFHHYQMPNGVHVHGRRYEPYGGDNYPYELKKNLQLTENRERALWAHLNNKKFDLVAADSRTIKLPDVETNSPGSANNAYLYGDDALKAFKLADGYKIELFASESEFPNLANPAQASFDHRGRLWVAVLPSYPHYRAGDPRPNDKLLIYEDTDNDGRADKEIVFADNLHLPIGFELTPHGVYLSQAPNLMLLKDIDGDDRADTREIILSGFDTHDTHHAISAFTADPAGSIILAEGVFLHTNVETAYGPLRGVDGGFFRFTPHSQRLERLAQTDVPNPWGVAFDSWGQDFYLDTSSPSLRWMLPVQVKAQYGQTIPGSVDLIEADHRVRPTSGLELISSRHFPDEVQGDLLLNNTIGFLGAKQHQLRDAGTGYITQFRHDLYQSSDPNFRPVDMEFAPDGSLYVVDWHNQLIGHMQHNARDPLRDHAHGRIYRVTYPARPLIKAPDIADASIDKLLSVLKEPDYRLRYRARRELRGYPTEDLNKARQVWINSLDKKNPNYERWLLEALWATEVHTAMDTTLIRNLLKAKDFRVRAAAVRALRYNLDHFDDALALLKQAANDVNGRVRLEAIVAASWVDTPAALSILETARKHPLDSWTQVAYEYSLKNLGGVTDPSTATENNLPLTQLPEAIREQWQRGGAIYNQEGSCGTCHQPDGKGLPAALFPPLAESEWVTGNIEQLIDITLHGLTGPIEVNGKSYPGNVPMPGFSKMLTDNQIADVLTYIRNAFGDNASKVSAAQVEAVRTAKNAPDTFWTAEKLKQKYAH